MTNSVPPDSRALRQSIPEIPLHTIPKTEGDRNAIIPPSATVPQMMAATRTVYKHPHHDAAGMVTRCTQQAKSNPQI